MKSIIIYDPALCCSTGACGPSPDAALSEFASNLQKLKEQVSISRFNLAQEPGAFAENETVKDILQREGPDALPAIFINGTLVMKGVYPTASQLEHLLNVAAPGCADESEACCGNDADECCGDDDDDECCSELDSKQGDTCCEGSSCC